MLAAGITAAADGPDEMREVIRHHVDIGVDNVKISMSGEEVGCLANFAINTCTANNPSDYRDPCCPRLLLHG
jgi:hypothetical protein